MNSKEYLKSYNISWENGFLPAKEPLKKLPKEYQIWDDVAQDFSGYLNCKKFREIALKMPILSIEDLTSIEELERAMLLLSCFGHGFVWEDYNSSGYLPKSIAIPWTQVAKKLDRSPCLSYASVSLQNWAKVNPEEPIELDNLRTLIQFHGGIDESWFYLVATEIEAKGANILRCIATIKENLTSDNYDLIKQKTEEILSVLSDLCDSLNRTYEYCDPYIFFTRVRPFLASLKDIKYEGCEDNPRNYFGGSAAQSSLIQSLDALFGVRHEENPAKFYLKEMRKYMPKIHAQFIEDNEKDSSILAYVKQDKTLTDLFNQANEIVVQFRQIHIEIVAKYIMAQTPKHGPGHTGTGGMKPMEFLKQIKNTAQKHEV